MKALKFSESRLSTKKTDKVQSMSPDTIATIISVSIVVLAIAIIVIVIVSKVRHLSRTLFGTSSLIECVSHLRGEYILELLSTFIFTLLITLMD